MSNFVDLKALLKNNDNNTATYSLTSNAPLFNKELSKDYVIAFDIDAVKDNLSKSKLDYADYSILKASSLYIDNINNTKELDGFDVTFKASSSKNYGLLIHPSITECNEYLMISKYEEDSSFDKDPQEEFEENYITSPVSWEDGGKFTYQIISNIGSLIVGVATDNPASIASGIFGILGTISESFLSKGASIEDVMNQLKEMDRKIDELSAKIDRNTQQLADEIVRAEAMVDQANLNTLNLAINDFAINSIGKINTFNRNLADEVGFYYRDYVKTSQTVKLVLTKNDKGEWESTPLGELGDAPSYNFSLTIDEFINAKEHLAKHSNIVEEGFMDELDKDIDTAISKKSDLPDGIDTEILRKFITSMIYEQFAKSYFSSHKDKAQEYRNLMIEYAERVSGMNGKIAILNSYLSRVQYMYNFASEIKANIRTICANLLSILDMNTARASEASLFAEYSSSELETKYKSTRETLQKFYENVKTMPDSYSFTTMAELTVGFFDCRYDLSYSNPGNHCTLNVDFTFNKLEMSGINVNVTKDKLSNHASISPIQHSRIATRWNLLRSTGSTDIESDYITYLANSGVLSKASVDAAHYLISLHQSLEIGYRIITSDRTERELNSGDTNLYMYCVGQGNPDGDYFIFEKSYGYRVLHDASCWYGRCLEGVFIDAASGTNLGTQRTATWARYAESHWYWSNDEYWAFKTFDNANYFFSIDVVTSEA